MNIKGAIFDADGTLIDSLMYWDVFWEKFGERYFGDKSFRPSVQIDKAIRTLPLPKVAQLLHSTYPIAESAQQLLDESVELCKWFYSELVELKPGVRELLEHLWRQGIPMCIASASETELLEIVLAKHDIRRYFRAVVSCTEVGKSKSHPDVFFAARDILGTPTESTWIFEDSVVAVETAAKAGFPIVGVYDKHGFEQARIKKLADEYIEEGSSYISLIDKIV